jgi:hypothetical protein
MENAGRKGVGLFQPGGGGGAAKQISPPCAGGASAAESAAGTFESDARLIMRKEIRPRFTINPALEKPPAAAHPLVAWELMNRLQTIPAAFGRKAWTCAAACRSRTIKRFG